MDYIHSAHSVYMLTYHVVFVVKYRRKVITDAIGDDMKLYAASLLKAKGCRLISAETDKDHMHLLIATSPQTAPSSIITILKSRLSYMVRTRYANHVKRYLWGNAPFWSNSYFIATTGTTSMERVKQYIDSQRTDGHQSKRK